MVLRKQLWLDDYGVTNEMKYIRLRQLAFPSHPKSFHISGRNPFLFHKSRAKISGALVRGKRFPPCVPIKDLPTSQGKVPLQEKCTLLSRVLRVDPPDVLSSPSPHTFARARRRPSSDGRRETQISCAAMGPSVSQADIGGKSDSTVFEASDPTHPVAGNQQVHDQVHDQAPHPALVWAWDQGLPRQEALMSTDSNLVSPTLSTAFGLPMMNGYRYPMSSAPPQVPQGHVPGGTGNGRGTPNPPFPGASPNRGGPGVVDHGGQPPMPPPYPSFHHGMPPPPANAQAAAAAHAAAAHAAAMTGGHPGPYGYHSLQGYAAYPPNNQPRGYGHHEMYGRPRDGSHPQQGEKERRRRMRSTTPRDALPSGDFSRASRGRWTSARSRRGASPGSCVFLTPWRYRDAIGYFEWRAG